MMGVKELSYNQLKKQWDLSILNFSSIKEENSALDIIGQERAVKAMEFGVNIESKGYNIYVSGIPGSGRTTYAAEFIRKISGEKPVPDDWCYVIDFDNPSHPIAISLPPGKGREFSEDIQELIEDIQVGIIKAFNSDDYENEKSLIIKEYQEKKNELYTQFTNQAEQQGFQVNTTNSGIYFSPVIDGKALSEEEYDDLEEHVKDNINKKLSQIQLEAMEIMREIKNFEKEVKGKLQRLDHKIGLFAVEMHIEEIKNKYREFQKVTKYLMGLEKDILLNIDEFKESESSEDTNSLIQLLKRDKKNHLWKYKVNLLVDNSDLKGAPVLLEYNPTYSSFFGAPEYENNLGALMTDYTMIKPGILHRANGGYLILQAKDILSTPFLWDGLKRVLKTNTISMENVRDQLGLPTVSALQPEPININVKVILIGSEEIYHLLYQLDEDFSRLFRIKVDFNREMDATEKNFHSMVSFIKNYCKKNKYRELTESAILKLVEYSSRLVEDQEKLTTRFNDIIEIIIEADTWSKISDEKSITADYIEKTIEEKEYRSSKYEEKVLEMLIDGSIMVETSGQKIGQINGLAIMSIGDLSFGKPSKITAVTYMGKNGIMNIEREVDMSGTAHSKGVYILSGYIGEKYAQNVPLALTANICFEQLYGEVDGDSASSTELYAILSSLSNLPIKQNIAVTGSVNQKGEIQPVGGVTKKVEGFFTLCKTRGLDGSHGVIIPYQNIRNLVLKWEVIDAVREGRFHIYPIKTIDEGIEILTGIPAGCKDKDGNYEIGTVHHLVNKRIHEYACNINKQDKENNN